MHSTPDSGAEVRGQHQPPLLKREVGLFGATMMGLGSIIGTGVFVSIGIAAGVAGPAVVLAIAISALIAVCNGLSSAQLAASHPVSGGTYEYGYRWLTPSLGFTAGWMFLCAKSASAATAALGFSGYVLNAVDQHRSEWLVPLALGVVLVLTALVLSGIRRSSNSNIGVVSITLLSLVVFVLAGLPTALGAGTTHLKPFFAPVSGTASPVAGFLQACALMFVAYTGYGRIATLAEEVRHPRRTIPLAVIVTLLVSMSLYSAVGLVGVAAVGAEAFAAAETQKTAPLEIVARQFDVPGAAQVVAAGAVTAMLGVLLNLILGLSRVVLAMGRRRDIPSCFGNVTGSAATPYAAVILVGALIAGLVSIGNVKTTWSFSAFTVLIYYAITNLAAIRLRADERLYPRVIPWLGLLFCLFLAFWVEPLIWLTGLGLIAGGLAWHWMMRFNK
ncbi:MAG: amino acid permease [Pirellulaceae bacterium]|nr:amino acid permease [Pirellulaceae bacterium]